MPQKHDLEIIISPDGQLKVEVKGMKGPACLASLKALADKVGTMTSHDLHAEYYEKPSTGTQGQQRL